MSAPKSTEPSLAPADAEKTGASWTLWLGVAAGFLFLSLLWTGMFIATRHADTRTVPVATPGGRP